ncbi:MAG TPA: M67 family peptidase [Acidiferrobacteraceae bacterium]|nr:M67 family peptidase [Acidiferrobacteraceae bacterium]
MAYRKTFKGPQLPGVFLTADSIHLPTTIVDVLCDYARASPQREICGILAIRGGAVVGHYPVRNTARESQHRFEMDPRQQIGAFRSMRKRGEELFAIYHSHPNGSAQPSEHDVSRHEYPEAYCFIISLQRQSDPVLGAYRIANGIFTRVGLEVEPS